MEWFSYKLMQGIWINSEGLILQGAGSTSNIAYTSNKLIQPLQKHVNLMTHLNIIEQFYLPGEFSTLPVQSIMILHEFYQEINYMNLTYLRSLIFICSSLKCTELFLVLPNLVYFAVASVDNFRLIDCDPKTIIIKDFHYQI